MLANLALMFTLFGPPQALNPCGLVTREQAGDLIGEPIQKIIPENPERDPESGGLASSCTFIGKSLSLVVAQVEFSSAERARASLTEASLKSQVDPDEGAPTVEREAGLGQRAFWITSKRAVQIAAVADRRVLSVIVGGGLAGADKYRAPLHRLTAKALGKS